MYYPSKQRSPCSTYLHSRIIWNNKGMNWHISLELHERSFSTWRYRVQIQIKRYKCSHVFWHLCHFLWPFRHMLPRRSSSSRYLLHTWLVQWQTMRDPSKYKYKYIQYKLNINDKFKLKYKHPTDDRTNVNSWHEWSWHDAGLSKHTPDIVRAENKYLINN